MLPREPHKNLIRQALLVSLFRLLAFLFAHIAYKVIQPSTVLNTLKSLEKSTKMEFEYF